MRDLVGGDCSGDNPLMSLARHFSQDQAKTREMPLDPRAMHRPPVRLSSLIVATHISRLGLAVVASWASGCTGLESSMLCYVTHYYQPGLMPQAL